MSSEVVEGKPDTGLHDIRKLAEQHRAKAEAEEAARQKRDVTPITHVVAPMVALPVQPARRLPRWALPAGAACVVIVGAVALLAVLLVRGVPTAPVAAVATRVPAAAPPAP